MSLPRIPGLARILLVDPDPSSEAYLRARLAGTAHAGVTVDREVDLAAAVDRMVAEEPDVCVVRMPEDAADALAVALCHQHTQQSMNRMQALQR